MTGIRNNQRRALDFLRERDREEKIKEEKVLEEERKRLYEVVEFWEEQRKRVIECADLGESGPIVCTILRRRKPVARFFDLENAARKARRNQEAHAP